MDDETILLLAKTIIDDWHEYDCDGEIAVATRQDDQSAQYYDLLFWLTGLIKKYDES